MKLTVVAKRPRHQARKSGYEECDRPGQFLPTALEQDEPDRPYASHPPAFGSVSAPWPPPTEHGFIPIQNQLVYTGEAVGPEPHETGWKDTIRATPGACTRIIVNFSGYPGRYV